MATLQAARAFELGLPLKSAKSWGLNRAIFYAAAKRGFKGSPRSGSGAAGPHKAATPLGEYYLGDEKAYTQPGSKDLYFEIGGKAQTEKDFEKQIESRFGGKFGDAWDDALDYVRQFDPDTLKSGEGFFASVYRPKRDEFAARWTTEAASAPRK